MIYLATPYSHPDHAVEIQRFERACIIAGKLMMTGEIVFCPIAHSHPIAVRCELPRDYEYWQRQAREMVKRSDKLVVAMMDGWKASIGIAGEIALAESFKIPVEYIQDPCA